MIPLDVSSRSPTAADAAQRTPATTPEITDKLSGLVAGQTVRAEIQALLPNGAYRALIDQRNVTLALPFSAQAGDSLELQVTESDGKIALAVVSRLPGGAGKPAGEGVSATLSRTGQLIGTLFSGAGAAKEGATALALNGGQPLAGAAPATAREILPQLRQAIAESGMFYESHQAEWVEGRFPKNALLREPQGKLSSPAAFAPPSLVQASPENPPADATVVPRLAADAGSGQAVAPQVQPVVQHQLEALATQNFVWQGQVWPGQEMRWEIEEEGGNRGEEAEEPAASWRTRLRLALPNLGGIDARIRLHGDEVIVTLAAGKAEARALLRSESDSLRGQLREAGLSLASIGIGEEQLQVRHEEDAQ